MAVVRPNQTLETLGANSSEDLCSLSRLPSPMERSGSIVGDPQLPVPLEFMDRISDDGEEEVFEDGSKVNEYGNKVDE